MAVVGPTPGDWFAAKADSQAIDADDVDPNRWAVLVKDGDVSFFVASIENGRPGDTMDTEEANARVMAASKDLFLTLRPLVAWVNENVDEWDVSPMVQKAQAALAKAEGLI
jgi:hypothetical protein